MPARIVAIVGPTAVGKSALALQLAAQFGGEIVSADSRQVYRYMDVGTAKPSLDEQAAVRHRMIDLVEPSEVYTAGAFRDEGTRVLRRLSADGKPAFVVGGTGFYVRALLDGIPLPSIPPDPVVRRRLKRQAEELGAEGLWGVLQKVDPASAARIHPNNLPRTIRALEVVEVLQGPVPAGEIVSRREALYIGLRTDRHRLYARADARVLSQVHAGLVDETRLLLDMGYNPTSPALDGFGYREAIAHIEGRMSLDAAVDSYQRATRRYIRRQLTWFRADERIQWFDTEEETPGAITEAVGRWLQADLR